MNADRLKHNDIVSETHRLSKYTERMLLAVLVL